MYMYRDREIVDASSLPCTAEDVTCLEYLGRIMKLVNRVPFVREKTKDLPPESQQKKDSSIHVIWTQPC